MAIYDETSANARVRHEHLGRRVVWTLAATVVVVLAFAAVGWARSTVVREQPVAEPRVEPNGESGSDNAWVGRDGHFSVPVELYVRSRGSR